MGRWLLWLHLDRLFLMAPLYLDHRRFPRVLSARLVLFLRQPHLGRGYHLVPLNLSALWVLFFRWVLGHHLDLLCPKVPQFLLDHFVRTDP